jgi:hypothetical protein
MESHQYRVKKLVLEFHPSAKGIEECAAEAAIQALQHQCPVEFDFNGRQYQADHEALILSVLDSDKLAHSADPNSPSPRMPQGEQPVTKQNGTPRTTPAAPPAFNPEKLAVVVPARIADDATAKGINIHRMFPGMELFVASTMTDDMLCSILRQKGYKIAEVIDSIEKLPASRI